MMHKALPSSTAIIWLILSLSLAALPHFLYQPLWVSFIFLIGIGWRCMNIWFDWPLPRSKFGLMRLLQVAIAAFAILAILVDYGTTIGRDAGVAFLVMMLGLKVTEIKSQRDYYVTVFIGYFVVITNFFFTQSIPMMLMMFVVVAAITSCLISLNDPKHQIGSAQLIRLSGQMLLQSLPIMLILFVLFPRISGPLWGLPQDAHAGKTGMDNTMQIGKINQLTQSDEVAFRVQFEGDIPPNAERYWRGPVLWNTNGSTWTELDLPTKQADIELTGTPYRYSIVLEPHNEHWLFALDLPDQPPAKVKSYLTADAQLKTTEKITQRVRYTLTSHPHYVLDNADESLLKIARALPEAIHPRTRQLAQQWRAELADDEAYLQHVLNYFNQQDFYYTLTPPILSGDVIDQFLFESRRGFCEHYAASFTVLMRAAGIPTRVVNGYQGGEINPITGDLVIRQRDAHAWTEVWLKHKGWVRIDPTAAVSRDRIELGMTSLMPAAMRSPFLVAQSDMLIDLWQSLQNNWDALNSMWNLWVLAYGPERQRELLEKLGMKNPNWQKMAIWLGLLIGSVFILLPLFLFYQRHPLDPVEKSYQQFCHTFVQYNLLKAAHEGPADFCQRAITALPHYADDIEHISQLYIALKYGKSSPSIQALEQAVKQFKPTSKQN